MNIFGWFATICLALCFWPQIFRSFKTKKTNDLSFWALFIQLIGYLVGTCYGLELKEWPLIVGYVHGLLSTMILLVLYFKYRG